MWKILIFLIVGMFIGSTVKITDKMKSVNDKFQHLGVILLLFTMGAAIGLDRSLLSNFQSLGLKSAIFALLTTLFSILSVYLISKLINKGEHV